MVDIATVIDDFADGTIGAPWGNSGNGAAETGGALVLPCVAAFSFAETTGQDHDLTGSGIFTEVSGAPSAGVGVTSQALLALRTGAGDAGSLRIGFDQGNMVGQYVSTASAFTTVFSVAYSGATHRWWRITEASGTVTYWTSPDGTSWTNQGTASVLVDLDFGITLLDVHYLCGQFGGPEETLGSASVERVNIGPNDHAGGSVAGVTVAAVGAGTPAISGGAVAAVTVTATGAGVVSTDFPAVPLPLTVELFYDGAWNDITADTYSRDTVRTVEGRDDEASVSDPSRMSLTLNNRNGKYSPRNPASTLYGKIGRNTPIRLRMLQPALGGGLVVPGNLGSFLAAPHASGDDITGDIDLRLEVTFDEWPPVDVGLHFMGLARRFGAEGSRAWGLSLGTDPASMVGQLWWSWTTDGTASTFINESSTAAITPTAGTPIALRVTLDVDDGAGNYVVTFYTSTTIGGVWTQLGSAVTTAGTTSLFASTADLELGRTVEFTVGALSGLLGDGFYGRLRAFELRSGIGGTVINSADLISTSLIPGTRSFVSAQGDQWAVTGGAHFTDTSILLSGEASDWPTRWEETGNDVWVPIRASGIGRRLQQGRKPLASVVRRGVPQTLGTVAYWPCEEGRDATRIASAFEGHPSGSLFGEVTPGSYSGFRASAPIPEWGAGGRLHLFAPDYTETASQRFIALVHIPDATFSSEVRLLALVTVGTVKRWEIMVKTLTSPTPHVALRIRAFDATETLVVDDGFFNFGATGSWAGRNLLFSVRLTQQGADIEYGFFGTDIATGEETGSGTVGTATGETYGHIAKIYTTRDTDDLQGTAIGHLIIVSPDLDDHTSAWETLPNLAAGLTGETAANRIDRLATEEGIPTALHVGADVTEPMGLQGADRLVELFRQAAASDLGVLGDARDHLAVAFRSRASLYSQPAALTLDYTAGQIAPRLEPAEDDQAVRNDITVERIDGSTRRAVATTGPLSTADPPAGVGRYDVQVSLVLASDGQLDHQAAWRLHLGTFDGLRYPIVRVAVHRNPTLLDAVNTIRVGDRIVLTNLPSWLPPGDASLLVNRIKREMRQFEYFVDFVCSPADPWAVALTGLSSPSDAGPTDRARADTAGSQLAVAIDANDTSLSVSTTAGPIWTTDAADLPFDIVIGGEVMRVTAISGASSPQTFTVTRAQNGISKSHASGAAVALAYPAVAAL